MERNYIHFEVHGKVVGKGRPHFVKKTGVAITPQRTRSYESIIRDFALKEMDGREPFTFPIKATITAYHTIPVSWNKTKKEIARKNLIAPSKPDIDNVIKIALDACNRTVFVDDVQVVSVIVKKMFGDVAKLVCTFEEA
tara:strand:+ start:272 stop:688 length:417 start_codon:yes stop_codon:yes gene_type:complete